MNEISDQYTLSTRIRETLHSELHRGFRNRDGAPVVVKLLRGAHQTPLDWARLRHEYDILNSLDAPEIVKPLDLIKFGPGLALILEDAGETSLDRLMASGYLNLERSLEIAIALAKTVAEVHRHRIVHKDIKPQHFFVQKNAPNRVVLVDFGIATRLPHELQTVSRMSGLEGTLAYIAPEQTGRMNRVVDCRSDLYSLGVTLYELFAGHLPFETTDPLELVYSHIARIPPNPQVHRVELPEAISDIVMKLLAKAAEDRYQSAVGVMHDLEQCLMDLRLNGEISSLTLGERDHSGELSIPQKLYGREHELAQVLATFERTRAGAKELLLVSGVAGVGKSALVYELQQKIVRGGYFAAGKFDFLGCSVPYAPIAQAFRDLIRAALAEPPEVLATRREALLQAVGPNGQLLIDLVPELELIIGSQPQVPALGPSESQHRFEMVFQNFVRVFADEGHPLVLFLDDLQWADAGSLRLLCHVLTAPGLGHLLVIGAYRKNEINAAHPLSHALEELRRTGTSIQDITVHSLKLSHITRLLADTLACPEATVAGLAGVLLDKTRGNPFFLNQFLTTLYRDGLLSYSHEDQAWRWDVNQLSGRLVTDNVVEFMISRLQELPPATQEMLRLAACIGHEFDHETLVTVSRRSGADVKAALWEAVQQGLLVPLDGNYRYADGLELDLPKQAEQSLNAAYRFLHDRVHQAAYALIGAEERVPVHLSIGRLLLNRANDDPTDSHLFEVADHLNRGKACISEPAEKIRLAQLDLAAGRRARAAAAPGAGVQYLEAAIELLGAKPFTDHYELSFATHLLKAECEYLIGHLDEAQRLIGLVEIHARSALEKATARNLELTVLYKTGQLPAACLRAADTVRLLGGQMPNVEDQAELGSTIGAEFGAYQAALAGRSIESLADLPPMTDPTQLALLEVLANGVPAAFGSNPPLHVVLVLKGVQLLSVARAPLGGFFYEQYAIVHSVITGDLDTAYKYGQLGIEFARRSGDASTGGQVYFLFGGFTAHWRTHISNGLELLRSALRLSLESGDRFYAAFASSVAANYRLYAGENLEGVQVAINAAREVAEQAGDIVNQAFTAVCQQAVRALQGKTNQLGTLSGADFDEASFESTVAVSALPFYGTVKAMVRYLDGKADEALVAADAWQLPPGMFFHGENALYRTLSAIELARQASDETRAKLLERVEAEVRTIERWAQSAPDNHAHRLALVQAEFAAFQDQQAQAIDLYDRAIQLAQQNGFLNQEALANELAARFHWSKQRKTVARAYLADAVNAYKRWGAEAKLKALRVQYASIFEQSELVPGTSVAPLGALDSAGNMSTARTQDNDTTSLDGHGHLDLAAAIQATEAIATELVVDRLWERLMRTLLENAGAQRGCVILDRAGVLQVEATIAIEPNVVKLGLAEKLDDCRVAPPTLVQLVARTAQPVVLADAMRDPRFVNDTYLSRVCPKSVLCVPMLQRGKLAGVLYLENNVATNAFSPDRCELLQFLATQAAVAFENARLYSELTAATDELRQSNEKLENEVAQRTAELRKTVSDLWSEMDLARKIQTVLLPKQVRVSQYEVAASMVPADTVGGDYYDMIETGGRDWILIGDVSGHGVTAGLIMMMIQTAVRAIVLGSSVNAGELSPAHVLTRVNHAVRGNLERVSAEQYMTITALELRPGVVRYSGLHQDILIHRAANNTVERLETRGMWLGITDDIASFMHDDEVKLAPGDTMLLFTDGISESFIDDQQMFGVDGLLRRFHALAAQELAPAAIVRGVLGPFSGSPAADDMTVVAVRYAPGG